jgi:hypothetical protein
MENSHIMHNVKLKKYELVLDSVNVQLKNMDIRRRRRRRKKLILVPMMMSMMQRSVISVLIRL